MSDTTFPVSPEVTPGGLRQSVDYVHELRTALRRPLEALWTPEKPLVACDADHALLSALKLAFYEHLPLRLSPDAIWITLARGFASHVNLHAEDLRHKFVRHEGRKKIEVERRDFFPGANNPWPEAFAEFSDSVVSQTGGMAALVTADFSTTGPVERTVSQLMVMESFKAYFEYVLYAGCGIPSVTLTGTVEDWQVLRERSRKFAEYGLRDWVDALDPILEQFERAKAGRADRRFWQSIFRYRSGSGPAVMTGWANVLFPYFKDESDQLFTNPYLKDWEKRLDVDDRQDEGERRDDPQGVGMDAIPGCVTAVPVKVFWGNVEADMRFVGGLLGVSQDEATLAVEPECGWAVIYEEPVDPLSPRDRWLEDRRRSQSLQ